VITSQLLARWAKSSTGTPVRTAHGSIAIEHIQPGDLVVSRPENDEHALARSKRVEEVFVLQAQVVALELGGQTIETTAEHPVYVAGRGWIPNQNLAAGDQILGEDGNTTPVTAVYATGRTETVYNFRVAEDHTYFVGNPDWGFSLWVHNTYSVTTNGDVLDDAGKIVGKIERASDGKATYKSSNGNAEYQYNSYEEAVKDAKNGFTSASEGIAPSRGLWNITAEGASKIMKHGRFGTFFKSESDGLWWAVDNAGHGGSAFKVFKETGKGLEWIADADRFGDFIVGKHKGPTGLFIPWSQLRGL